MMRMIFQYPGTYGVDLSYGDRARHRGWHPAPDTFDPGVLHPCAIRDGHLERAWRGIQDQSTAVVRRRFRRDSRRADPVQRRLGGAGGRDSRVVTPRDSDSPGTGTPDGLQTGRLALQHFSTALRALSACQPPFSTFLTSCLLEFKA